MEKKFVFAFILCLLQFFSASASIFGQPVIAKNAQSQLGTCNAPPPDSFRITGLGPGYVTLSWNPTAPGDNHFLTIFKESVSSEWDSLYSVTINNARSYTATDIDHSKAHKIVIRTICSNGELGTLSPPIYPPHGLILELVIEGRTPTTPHLVNDCTIPVSYVNNNWLGFRLTKTVGNSVLSSLFEFEKIEDGDTEARIRRICENNPLVAASLENAWPTKTNGIVPIYEYLFKVGEVTQGIFHGFGLIKITLDPAAKQLSLCPVSQLPPPYSFQFLVSNSGFLENYCPPNNGFGNQGLNINETTLGPIKVQNPSSEFLNLFFTQQGFQSGLYDFTLLDLNGRRIYKEKMDVPEPQITIPVQKLTPGLYFLQVEFKGQYQNIKVIISR